MRFDALIVGAGPAGCLAARDLARDGGRVALVDDSHPRQGLKRRLLGTFELGLMWRLFMNPRD